MFVSISDFNSFLAIKFWEEMINFLFYAKLKNTSKNIAKNNSTEWMTTVLFLVQGKTKDFVT